MTYKIIKIRKNPEEASLEGEVWSALKKGKFDNLDELRIIYHQSDEECDDCEEPFFMCECEKCDDCGQKRCVCFIKDLKISDHTAEDRNEIRKITWEFAKQKLSDAKIRKLMNLLDFYLDDPISSLRLKRTELKFLRSLSADSRFPKYRKIVKELFD